MVIMSMAHALVLSMSYMIVDILFQGVRQKQTIGFVVLCIKLLVFGLSF